MASETLLYDVSGGRATITLNRPEKRNALSLELLQELNNCLWAADDDTRVHSVVLKANGVDFCSGYDITGYGVSAMVAENKRSSSTIDDDAWRLEHMQRLYMALFDMHKPVIAQVHGRCLAGGTDIALLCDMVICSSDARFGFPALRAMGSPPSHMWLYHVGPQWAKRLLLTGDSILGTDAAAIGLALKAVPCERLADEVDELTARLSFIDSDLLSANKRIVNLGLEMMGARSLQRMATEQDSRAHLARSNLEFKKDVAALGLKRALLKRDEPFGDGIIHR